ncbi:MAG: CDP-alcohol phosphatidyltransferase family protein [Clostridia bacterium]|nr:CDP-alcohol phosphatidyltransferase family protein [Clostridia bacterium]
MNETKTNRKSPLIGVWNLANCVTWLGITAAVVAMYFALSGNPRIAMLLFLVSGLCDLFDGRVARMFKRTDVEKAFGIQLDSFADTVSFVVFPAVFLLTLTTSPWAVVLAILYILAGITRLCWFDITTDGDTKYFAGVPVTYMALVLPLAWIIVSKAAAAAAPAVTAAVLAVMGILYVLNIRVKKPGGVWYAVFGVLAIVLAVLLLVL